ncbi:MAG: hypothetical protein M0Q95_17450 [Porticoccaceae bacterium]|nr:hypothetical protein [Porticoccaceae bacterium]
MLSQEILLWVGTASIATLIISLMTLPWLVAKIPADYFNHDRRTPTGWKTQHPLLRAVLLIMKNLLGYVLLVGGVLMLFIPGQGILTMAMGLLLMDYPGKYQLERRIVAIPAVFRGLNWLRTQRGVKPLNPLRH